MNDEPRIRSVVVGLWEVIWAPGDSVAYIYGANSSEPFGQFHVPDNPTEDDLLRGLYRWESGR